MALADAQEKKSRQNATLIHEADKNVHGQYDAEVLKVLKQMIGATITDAGFIKEAEGGLTIDFVKDNKKMRFVMGYNDLGEWVKYFGDKA